jgi:hypothetical protein
MALINLLRKLQAVAKSKLEFSSPQTDLEHKVSSKLKSSSAKLVYFLDVGANVGQSAITYSKLALENGQNKAHGSQLAIRKGGEKVIGGRENNALNARRIRGSAENQRANYPKDRHGRIRFGSAEGRQAPSIVRDD